MKKGNSFLQIWGAPILLAVLTLFGLITALIGAGLWHGLAWAALTVPVAVCIGYGWKRSGRKQVG